MVRDRKVSEILFQVIAAKYFTSQILDVVS